MLVCIPVDRNANGYIQMAGSGVCEVNLSRCQLNARNDASIAKCFRVAKHAKYALQAMHAKFSPRSLRSHTQSYK